MWLALGVILLALLASKGGLVVKFLQARVQRIPHGLQVDVRGRKVTVWTSPGVTAPDGRSTKALWLDLGGGVTVQLRAVREHPTPDEPKWRNFAVATVAYVWHDGVRDTLAAGWGWTPESPVRVRPTVEVQVQRGGGYMPTWKWLGLFVHALRQSIETEGADGG